MAKKIRLVTPKNKKTQEQEDADFIKLLESDAGKEFLGNEKKMLKMMKKTDKYLGLKF